MKKNIIIVTITITTLVVTYYIYPQIIVKWYGRHIPHKWMLDYTNLNLEEIHQSIGKPHEDISEKQTQNWTENYWWGSKMLKIITGYKCPPTVRPHLIIYIVLVNGWKHPAYYKIFYQREGLGIGDCSD